MTFLHYHIMALTKITAVIKIKFYWYRNLNSIFHLPFAVYTVHLHVISNRRVFKIYICTCCTVHVRCYATINGTMNEKRTFLDKETLSFCFLLLILHIEWENNFETWLSCFRFCLEEVFYVIVFDNTSQFMCILAVWCTKHLKIPHGIAFPFIQSPLLESPSIQHEMMIALRLLSVLKHLWRHLLLKLSLAFHYFLLLSFQEIRKF